MLHHIHIPDTIVFSGNLNNRRLQVIRHFIFKNIVNLSLLVLKYHFRLGAYDFYASPVARQRLQVLAPVKEHQFRSPHHFYKQRF